jgi:hypothetical protein
MPVMDGVASAGQQDVGVPCLRDSFARVRPVGQFVALQHDHVVHGPGQSRGGEQAGHAPADDDSTARHGSPSCHE